MLRFIIIALPAVQQLDNGKRHALPSATNDSAMNTQLWIVQLGKGREKKGFHEDGTHFDSAR